MAADPGCRVAEEALGRTAEGTDGARLVDDDHGLGHGVEDRAQVCLACAQVRLGLFLFVDAEDDATVTRRSAIRADIHPPARAQPADVTVRPHDPVVDFVAPALPQGPLDGLRPGLAVIQVHEGLGRGESLQVPRWNAEEADAGRRNRDPTCWDVQRPDTDADLVEGLTELVDGERPLATLCKSHRVDGFRHR